MDSKPDNKQMADKVWEYILAARLKLAIWLEPSNLEKLRPQLHYQTGVLAGFALLAAILLGLADLATRGVIQQRLQEDLQANLEEVVPPAYMTTICWKTAL